VRLPVALGAGVPVGLRGLRGWPGLWDSPSESGVAFLPRRCAGRGAVPCGAVCVSALAVAAAAFSTAWRTLGSLQLAAAAALAAARRAAAAALSGELPPVALGTVVPRSSGAHCWYRAGGCRGGRSGGREVRAYGVGTVWLPLQWGLRERHYASQTERG
jgi:hypothetical protein